MIFHVRELQPSRNRFTLAVWEGTIRHAFGFGFWRVLAALVLLGQAPGEARASVPSPIEERARAIECLTLAVAYEAGNESDEGQQAVAEVVLNRVRHPFFPKSVCGVVFAGSTRRTGCQFSFTCDGSLRRRLSQRTTARARDVALRAIEGQLGSLALGATHYHADYVSPYWAPSLSRLTKIGAHIFYRMPGRSGPGALAPPPVAFAAAVGPTAQPPASSGDATGRSPAASFAPWGLAAPAVGTAQPSAGKSR